METMLARYDNDTRNIFLYLDGVKLMRYINGATVQVHKELAQQIISEVIMRSDTEPGSYTYVNEPAILRAGLKC